jgi:hypothetical protein
VKARLGVINTVLASPCLVLNPVGSVINFLCTMNEYLNIVLSLY